MQPNFQLCFLFIFFHINPEEEEEEEKHPIYLNENHPTRSNLPSSPSLEGFGDLGTEFFVWQL
jgi:hypothetical protein